MQKSLCLGNDASDAKPQNKKKINIRKKDSFACEGGKIIEGLRAKRALQLYRILVDFHFLQDRANFWQTDLL